MTHPSPLLFASRLLVLLLPLAGCGSTPSTDWYLLEATATPLPAAGGPSIGIARLEVADYLLAPQVQTHSGPNSVRRADFARWAEPLDQGVARVLLLDLAAVTGTERVRLAPWPRDWVPERELMVRIERLDAGPAEVELVATWSVQDGARTRPARDRLGRLSRPRSGAGAESVAADYSTLLGELARQIAADLTSPAADDVAPASD
jgi:uncharacterized lipoprotein YmbA